MRVLQLLVAFTAGAMFLGSFALAAPSPDLWPYWQTHAPDSTRIMDHSTWETILQKYLVADHPSGINRFRYADVNPSDKQDLEKYIEQLANTKVTSLARDEQQAYWINLYNALTVKVILDHYPVDTIRDIDISPGFFSNGPWDAELVTIEGQKVTLNDIEHRILRPIFKDNRLHYALNCASLGCPNLQPMAYTSANTEQLLDKGAQEYINSPRGASIENGKLVVSSIYKWFQEDFGDSVKGVLEHLRKYARGSLSTTLQTYDKGLRYEYDWALNQP